MTSVGAGCAATTAAGSATLLPVVNGGKHGFSAGLRTREKGALFDV